MSIIIDCRELACPEPVVRTNKALSQADEVTTIVDNDVARENVSRLAKSKGFGIDVEAKEGLLYLHMKKESAKTDQTLCQPVNGPTILLIASDSFGRGSEELGQLLMRSFLHTLNETSPLPDRIVCLNSGVKLVVEGSQVLDDLHALSEKGIEVLACGTCLGYYEIKDKVAVGRISNMYDIASALLSAGKVIEL